MGDTGEPVRDIQDRLSALGFAVGDPQGRFGESTRAAVLDFQESRRLDADGIVGPDTWRILVEAGYALGERLLYYRIPMMRGEDVAELQRRLNSLGFDAGKVDGIFGPDTQRAVLDFQHNRGTAEDGMAGQEVIEELELVQRATHKAGRDAVRERQWLRHLPASVAGQRVFIDAFCRDDTEDAAAWAAATAAFRALQELGAHPVLSRSADTRPSEQIRARRANQLGVDLVVSFAVSSTHPPRVLYFASQYSHSEAGRLLAAEIGKILGVDTEGRAMPILKETRPPAALIALDHIDTATGAAAGRGIDAFYRTIQTVVSP